MIGLSVNVDHVATLRQARRTYEPDPLAAAFAVELGGANGITLHLREDRRHIQDDDVMRVRQHAAVQVNLEMAATAAMVEIARTVKPHTAMLVPEGRQEITTEGGLDIVSDQHRIATAIARLKAEGITVSVFIDPDPAQIDAAAAVGADICELHTGPYAHAFYQSGRNRRSAAVGKAWADLARSAERIHELGMTVNAGHALNYHNVAPITALPHLYELHIGHAIVARALFVGMQRAVADMCALIARPCSDRG